MREFFSSLQIIDLVKKLKFVDDSEASNSGSSFPYIGIINKSMDSAASVRGYELSFASSFFLSTEQVTEKLLWFKWRILFEQGAVKGFRRIYRNIPPDNGQN